MVAPIARLIPPSLHGNALLAGNDGLTIHVVVEEVDIHRPPAGPIPEVLLREPDLPRWIFSQRLDGIAAVTARRTDSAHQPLPGRS